MLNAFGSEGGVKEPDFLRGRAFLIIKHVLLVFGLRKSHGNGNGGGNSIGN